MNMLPFTIKTTDQTTMHLCRITPPEQHEELDVGVGFLLRSWEIHHLHALRDSTRRNLTQHILTEVPNDAYKMFIRFLRETAEPEVFLPMDRLNGYLHRQYCLLLSPRRVRELFVVYNRGSRYSRRLINFSGVRSHRGYRDSTVRYGSLPDCTKQVYNLSSPGQCS